MSRKDQGFTLIELMIVVAIIAIIAAIAVPNLLSSRLAANESNAISTLRNLVSAQAQFQTTAAMDDDLDGTGEYGCFAEMSGACNLNLRAGGNGLASLLDPPILGATFQNVNANSFVTKSGYLIAVYLPDALGAGVVELANGAGPNVATDADNSEVFWSAIAWPVDDGTTGNRCFFVSQRGEIVQTKMDVAVYNVGAPPLWNAALNAAGLGTMGDGLGINGLIANDGNTWVAVQ